MALLNWVLKTFIERERPHRFCGQVIPVLYWPLSGPSSSVPPEPPKPPSKDIFAWMYLVPLRNMSLLSLNSPSSILRLLMVYTLAQSQCSQPVLIGQHKGVVTMSSVKISRIRQSGSSAVRCLTWTFIPAYLPGRRENTTAMNRGTPVSCAGAH